MIGMVVLASSCGDLLLVAEQQIVNMFTAKVSERGQKNLDGKFYARNR